MCVWCVYSAGVARVLDSRRHRASCSNIPLPTVWDFLVVLNPASRLRVFKLYPYSAPPPVPQAAPVDSEHYNVEERHSGREIRYQQPCVFDAEQVAFLSGDSESSQQMLSERMKACVDVICDIRATTDTIQTTALAPHSRWNFLYAEGWEAFIMTRATSADWRSCQH